MRRSVTIATTLAAAGALFAAVPVSAVTNNGTCDGTGPQAGAGQGPGAGQGQGPGAGQGTNKQRGPGAGTGQGMMNLPMGTLTEDQKADLVYMVQEEQLARDVYTVFSKKYPKTKVFKMISTSEQRHMDAIRRLLDRYGIADPTADAKAGQFTAQDLQVMYDDIIKSSTTRTKALKAGVAIEEDDIAELAEAAKDLNAPDVSRVYANLTRGSENHLAAFQSRL